MTFMASHDCERTIRGSCKLSWTLGVFSVKMVVFITEPQVPSSEIAYFWARHVLGKDYQSNLLLVKNYLYKMLQIEFLLSYKAKNTASDQLCSDARAAASCLPTDSLTDSITYWLTDWLTDWLTAWLTDSLTHWLTYWLTHSLTHSLTDWLTLCGDPAGVAELPAHHGRLRAAPVVVADWAELAGRVGRPDGALARPRSAHQLDCGLDCSARVARFGLFEAKKWQIWPFLNRLASKFFQIY